MVTGDLATTAAAVARAVGIEGDACSPDTLADEAAVKKCGIYARLLPELKFEHVQVLQHLGHVVGMCDGRQHAPALRQAQTGIAVSSATDVARQRPRWC